MTVWPTGLPSSSCKCLDDLASVGLGKPHLSKVPWIWRSRSVRSVTMIIVGLASSFRLLSFTAVQSIVRLLPLPCQCQITPPCRSFLVTRSTVLLTARNCWYLAIFLITLFCSRSKTTKFWMRSSRFSLEQTPKRKTSWDVGVWPSSSLIPSSVQG
ncbi:MAG: hypothetical protein BWY13_00212 [Euryarchaeota archaeon ADurb.Bin190]|nr:MAG: hypothetical protein BWY13_00212 [Euryarchaeota archaeon ADurb.Bin190]